jgi:hypothetical protein
MNKLFLLDNQYDYYNLKFVLFEIIKTLKNRELALLNSKSEEKHIATRYLYASSVKYLQMHLKELGVMRKQKLINLYRSNSTLKPNSIPVVTYDLKKRTKDKDYLKFKQDFNKYITGMDFIIDIDAKTIKRAYHIAKKIKKFFDDNKLPYFIQFSGTRGFHIIIPCEYIPSKLKNSYEIVLNALITTFDFKDEIDTSTLNPRGLIKVPYSFDTGNIALPLDDTQFQNFNPEMVKMENVLKQVKIKNRGLLLRTHNLSKEELIENVNHFLKQ